MFPFPILQSTKNKEAIFSNLPTNHTFPPYFILFRIRQGKLFAKVTEDVDPVKRTLRGDVDFFAAALDLPLLGFAVEAEEGYKCSGEQP